MTTRTYRHFQCENGHGGTERTSENDQPYSMPWESVNLEGLVAVGEDTDGYATYSCEQCGLPMAPTHVPGATGSIED
jgi:hypothetical protein